MARTVILGSTGFIGAALAAGLRAEGVVAFGRSDANLEVPESLLRTLQTGDVVVNAAGYANPADWSLGGRRRLWRANVEGVRNLAEACVERRCAQLIQLSTVAAMGRWRGTGIDETMMRPPATPYAESKLAAERLLTEYAARLDVTILRPTSVFGEGRPLARLLCRAVEQPLVPLPGSGRALVPFTYVGNVVHAVELVSRNPNAYGRTFIVGDAESYALRRILETLGTALGGRPRFVPLPVPVATLAVRAAKLLRIRGVTGERLDTLTQSVSYSIDAVRVAVGYRPLVGLDEACRRLATWYRTESRGAA